MNFKYLRKWSPTVLRCGLAFVFLWFGLNQLFNAQSWLVWLPAWTSYFPIEPIIFIYGNAFLEIFLGSFLAVGLFTRFSALLLSIHLLGITLSLGYNDIALRDLGLTIATLSVALHGHDFLSYDQKFLKSWWGHTSLAKFLYLYEKEDISSESI